MFDESDCLKTSTCQYSVIVIASSAGNSKFGIYKWLSTGLQSRLWKNCRILRPFYSAGENKPRFVSSRTSDTGFFYNSRCHFCCIWETSNGKRNKSITKSHYSFELRSADRLQARTVTQTNWSELRTALLGNQSWFCDTVITQCCEIQWEVFGFTAEWIKIAAEKHSYSAQKSVINRSNGADVENQKQ